MSGGITYYSNKYGTIHIPPKPSPDEWRICDEACDCNCLADEGADCD